jgi:hypothetical protein
MHRFIHKLFIPCKANTGDLSGLPADELYHVFKIQHPMNVLTAAITSNMLLTGGFVDQEDPEQSVLYARLNEPYFMELKKEAQVRLLPYIKDPLSLRFRQILLGVKVVNESGNMRIRPEFAVKAFVDVWTLNRQNADSYMQNLVAAHRSSATDVYNYYLVLCNIYGWPLMERAFFSAILEDLGYDTTKGRVYGRAGMRFYRGLYIPQTMEDKILSVEMNMCCISNGHTHWTSTGILENYKEVQREEVCDSNLERMGFNEQERAQIEEKKAQLDIRRAFEAGEIPLGQAKAKNEAQNDMGHNSGSASDSQTTETEAHQAKLEGIQRTSSFKEDRVSDAASEYSSGDPADFDDPLDIGETYRDRYSRVYDVAESVPEQDPESGADDEEVGEDAVDDDEPSLEQIASALITPYRMTPPGGFTKPVMRNWLQMMNIPDVEGVLNHYEEIMEILG